METSEITTGTPRKRISRTMRWALAHPGIIYEVTDPELRALLCNYRNKDKKTEEETVKAEDYETVDA
jgi:hypothetical protein